VAYCFLLCMLCTVVLSTKCMFVAVSVMLCGVCLREWAESLIHLSPRLWSTLFNVVVFCSFWILTVLFFCLFVVPLLSNTSTFFVFFHRYAKHSESVSAVGRCATCTVLRLLRRFPVVRTWVLLHVLMNVIGIEGLFVGSTVLRVCL
jgi:hypothetical protein